jgi:hypothetical protein
MAKSSGWSWWHGFFFATRGVYRVQRAARLDRAIASGKPDRVLRLLARRGAYKLFNRFLRGVGL